MAPKISHRDLLSIHQDRLENHQANINDLITNTLRNPLKEHLDIAGYDIKNARRIQTSNSLQVGTSATIGNSIIVNENIALGGNITDLNGDVLTFGGGGGGGGGGATTEEAQAITSNTAKISEISGNIITLAAARIVNNAQQTFAQLLTEQPNRFTKVAVSATSSQIVIEWNYADIIPTNESIRKLAQGPNLKSRCLPYINEIHIQIKGNVTGPNAGSNGEWVECEKIVIGSDKDYNTDVSRTITLTKTPIEFKDESAKKNILSKTDPFEVRIFGVNDGSGNIPNIDARALVIDEISSGVDLAFATPSPPSAPVFIEDKGKFTEVVSGNEKHFLRADFKVVQTESGVTGSAARVDDYKTTFTENVAVGQSSLRSGYFTLGSHTGNVSGNLIDIADNDSFTVDIGNSITSLRAGTKYNYTVTVTNNISTTDSSPASEVSPFTMLPGSDVDISLNLAHSTTLTSVTSPTFSNNVIYLNENIQDKTQFNLSNTSDQTFEITKPYTTDQETDTNGFGKFVDNFNSLVSISLKIDNVTKETILFNGFNETSQEVGDPSGNHGTTYFDAASIQDMYPTDVNNKGFRLSGTVRLKDIDSSNIGSAQSAPHKLQYVYERDSAVTPTPAPDLTEVEHDVYVDNLSGSPNLSVATATTDSITVNSIKYCMGIPSVENFTVNLERNYTNINSGFQFIRGDKLIGSVQTILNVSWSSTDFTSDPNITGEYTHDYTSSNKYYTSPQDFPNTGDANNLTITETANSLVGTTTSTTNNISANHYYDNGSFSREVDGTLTPKLDLSAVNVYEIKDATELAKLGSDLGDIDISGYTDHSVLSQPHTLLYINGGFRTNESVTGGYPNVNNYTWDVNVPNKYNSGNDAYGISGVQNDASGYKWIVFRIDATGDYVKTASNNSGGSSRPYIDVPKFLNDNGLGNINSTISTGFGIQNAIGFIRINATRNGQAPGHQIGRFTSEVNTSNPNLIWYAGQNPTTISLDTLLHQTNGINYGARIDTGQYTVDNNWGVECPAQSNFNSNDIDIFIGLKNKISLP